MMKRDRFNSPLLFPVKLKGDTIFVLDERKLPFKESYVKVKDIERALEVLKKMITRSFGQVLLFFYSCCLFKNLSFREIASLFKKIRPTFDFLFLADILESKNKKTKNILEAVEIFLNNFDQARRKRAASLAKLLPDEANILTLCNINGELGYLYEEMVKLKKKSVFFVSETRPYLQGSRLTFWELKKNHIPAFLLCDNQVAFLLREKKINCAVVGADRANTKGDIINKIGTYPLALLCSYYGVNFYALAQYPRSLDIEKIKIEERPGREVFMFLGGRKNIKGIYPSFDITKHSLITKTLFL